MGLPGPGGDISAVGEPKDWICLLAPKAPAIGEMTEEPLELGPPVLSESPAMRETGGCADELLRLIEFERSFLA